MTTFLVPESSKNFNCEICDYNTSRQSQYYRHLSTSKHINTTIRLHNLVPNVPKVHICCNCNKEYKHHSSLSKHKIVCNSSSNSNNISNEIESSSEKSENKDELIQYLINENKEFKNLILEIVKKDTTTNNNTNMINSNNKTFNLQFFLNETCKDAMNMSDFINSLTLQLSDLENVGKLGFVDGISNIIIKNLEALDVEKRPVHCCDAKRETMYIKDHDKWEKEDNELKRMKELVRYVRDKNISMVNIWRDLYPECVKSNSNKTTQFNEIYMESFGGEKGTKKEKEEKIISRIAKAVVIDKTE
jgi:hypothetical protein